MFWQSFLLKEKNLYTFTQKPVVDKVLAMTSFLWSQCNVFLSLPFFSFLTFLPVKRWIFFKSTRLLNCFLQVDSTFNKLEFNNGSTHSWIWGNRKQWSIIPKMIFRKDDFKNQFTIGEKHLDSFISWEVVHGEAQRDRITVSPITATPRLTQ